MDEFLLNLAAPLGALLAMLGACTQLGLSLGERLSYMRRVRDLDPKGAKAAGEKTIRMRYENPERLPWIPPKTLGWLRERASHMMAWCMVALGAFLLFISSLKPILVCAPKCGVYVISGLILLAALLGILVSAVLMVDQEEPGRLRAEAEWQCYHPEETVPEDPESRYLRFFEWCHCKVFGRRAN